MRARKDNHTSVSRSIRAASKMIIDLADGNFSVRIRETERGEIGHLQHALNAMAASVEASRNDLCRLAEEQAALRRVATLVARGAPPPEIFDAIAAELGRLLHIEYSVLNRYEPDHTITIVATWSALGDLSIPPAVGSRWGIKGSISELVLKTGQPARGSYDDAVSGVALWARTHGIKFGVGSPILVSGHLWGLATVLSCSSPPPPGDTEERMADFIELAGTAIANTESRAELTASRARIVQAADEARRRVERDLHDGTQQRLISLGVGLRLAEADLPADRKDLKKRLAHFAQTVTEIHDGVREIARGLYPPSLSKGGIKIALKTLAIRSVVPVEIDVHDIPRLTKDMEVAIYYIVSEALTNAAKYAHASAICVDLTARDTMLQLSIRDDGIGGADPDGGSGLIGLKDRIEALSGSIRITSPVGQGTSIMAEIPINQISD